MTAVLVLPSSIRPVHSAEIDLPKIQASCNPGLQALLPPMPFLKLSPTAYLVAPEHIAQIRKIMALIDAKQWDQALLEFQQGSTWVQDRTMQPLLTGMTQSNQTTRATQFVIARFPSQSQKRAQGIGAIAVELTYRNQFPDAIALVKSLPQNSDYLSKAIVPMVGALTSTNQTEKISAVMALFPDSNQQRSLWLDISNEVPVEPAQAKEIAGMIQQNFYLRSQVLTNMAGYWLLGTHRNLLKAWNIANEIEDCTMRTETFLEVVKGLKESGLNVSTEQAGQAMDQLETLITTIDAYRGNSSYFRLSLASLNIQHGRKAQGIKLLERVTQDLKQSDSAPFRAATLITLATQYQSIGDKLIAIRMLDAAVTETHAAYKQDTTPSLNRLPTLVPPAASRDTTLERIAKMYRSLQQPQKAVAIERTLPKRPRFTIPDSNLIFPGHRPVAIPSIKPISPGRVPSLKLPTLPRR
ncbi:MAG: hypothetical protein HC780_13570 [Leptolyngbyaceae cyanobacterium CSU_1_3]|nr:hypothetical protein [Leptolyngbyaceae cyanobacterium CSU_1_3]